MIRELEEIIIQNIKEIPKVPLALLLSGGIDSSLVLALLKKEYFDVPIRTFTLARSEHYPDIASARKVAKLFGTDHHEIILSDSEIDKFKTEYDKVKKYGFRGDVNVYILCSIASRYSEVLVTGDGGDESFGGYWLHKYPLGHKETGIIKSFEEVDSKARKYLKEMVSLGFRDFLFKEKSKEEDYTAVWEYFVSVMAPQHLAPLLHTAKVLNINVYVPLFSENLTFFLRTIPYTERVGRKIEKELAMSYLPKAIIERKSIGFDVALDE